MKTKEFVIISHKQTQSTDLELDSWKMKTQCNCFGYVKPENEKQRLRTSFPPASLPSFYKCNVKKTPNNKEVMIYQFVNQAKFM